MTNHNRRLITRHRNDQPGTQDEPDEFGLVTPDLTGPIEGLTLEELMAQLQYLTTYMGELEEYISPVRFQLAEAKSRVRMSGRYSDSSWYRRTEERVIRATLLLKQCGRRVQLVQRQQGQLSRALTAKNIEESKAAGTAFLRAFRAAAREVLPPAKYLELLKRAEQIRGEGATPDVAPHVAGPDDRPIRRHVPEQPAGSIAPNQNGGDRHV